MSVDNLPAVRTGADVRPTTRPRARQSVPLTGVRLVERDDVDVEPVTIYVTRNAPAPAGSPESGNYFLLAFVGVILAASAAWGHLWWQALGIGAGSVALGVAGVRNRRRERTPSRRVS